MAHIESAATGGTYGITGIPPPKDAKLRTKTIPYAPGMPVRREISEWFADANSWRQVTLYMLALKDFEAASVDQKLSYFQVAGIHCYPFIAWDNAPAPSLPDTEPQPPPGKDVFGGYCVHNAITFPTWHRPYMLLYEQVMWQCMDKIIEKWVHDKKEPLSDAEARVWREAANTWRMPYWDWARRQQYTNGFAVPKVTTMQSVTITLPHNKRSSIDNPLYQYDNPMKDESGNPLPFGKMPKGLEKYNIPDDPLKSPPGTPLKDILPWSKCTGTSRFGVMVDEYSQKYIGLQGVNAFDTANESLADPQWYYEDSKDPPGTWADAVNRLLAPNYHKTWGTFASTKWWEESRATEYISLEFIHNNIHNLAGGTNLVPSSDPDSKSAAGAGHLGDVPVSSFDPLFWLHHCNVDRLFAFWQALNWSLWWDKAEPNNRLSVNVPDAKPTDPLQPFHTKDNGNVATDVWTSNQARDWTRLHYQYDDLRPQPGAILPDGTLNETQYITDLRHYIETTYNSTSHAVHHLPREFKPPNMTSHSYDDYLINIVYDRYALHGRSYSIVFFLGNPPTDHSSLTSTTHHHHRNSIGSVFTFSGVVVDDPADEHCANCATQKKGKQLSKAQLPITIPLLRHRRDSGRPLSSLERAAVERYLEERLHWRFVSTSGEALDAERFPDTKVMVYRGTGRWGQEGQPMTVFEDYELLYAPTTGKLCGVDESDPVFGRPSQGG